MTQELNLQYPIFIDLIEPKGRLLIDKRCHACWYYLMLADKARVEVGDGIDSQIIMHDDNEAVPDWMVLRYDQIARSVALIYGLNSPEDFLPYFPLIEKEAQRQGFEIHTDILRPFGVGRMQ